VRESSPALLLHPKRGRGFVDEVLWCICDRTKWLSDGLPTAAQRSELAAQLVRQMLDCACPRRDHIAASALVLVIVFFVDLVGLRLAG